MLGKHPAFEQVVIEDIKFGFTTHSSSISDKGRPGTDTPSEINLYFIGRRFDLPPGGKYDGVSRRDCYTVSMVLNRRIPITDLYSVQSVGQDEKGR